MQNNAAQAQGQGAVGIPLQMWSHHFDKLHMELKTGNVLSSMKTFDGEGQSKFTEWLRDMEKAKVITAADDDNMRRLAAQTLHGPASEFVIRLTKETPRITWLELKNQLRKRFSDLADSQFARQALKRLKQGTGESTHNFAERIRIAAEEAYPGEDLNAPVIQGSMIEVFIDGIGSDHVARKLIKAKPDTLKRAVEVSTGEELASKAFSLRRRDDSYAQPEPMDCSPYSSQQKDTSMNTMATLVTTVGQLAEQVSQLTKMVKEQKKDKTFPGKFKFTEDGKPICTKCDKPGHIGRKCRNTKN